MSDSEEEREMIRKHKLQAKKSSAELRLRNEEARKRALERLKIKKEKDKKQDKLIDYAKTLVSVKLKDIDGLVINIMDNNITTKEQVKKYIENYNKPKSNVKMDIKKQIENIESVQIPKKKSPNKNISKVIEIAQMMANAPKKFDLKKATKDVDDSIAEIDKLLKAPKKEIKKLVKADTMHLKYHPSEQDKKEFKLDKKIMQQAKGYVHKVHDVSPRVQNYVDEYKSIINSGMAQAQTTTAINKLKLKLLTNMKPSEVDDVNKIISDYRKTLPPKEKATRTTKTKAPKPPDDSYEGDKKYKPMTAYVKKHRPDISDPEDIHIIVVDIIDKKIPRMSVKKLNEILDDLGYEVKGSGVHLDDSDTSSDYE
jgi:hypothetical protein